MKFSREQCSSIDHYLTLKIYDYALSSAPFYPVYLTATNPVFLCPSSRIYRVLSTPLFVSNHNTGSGRISLQQAVYLPLFSSPSLPLAALHTAWSKWFAAWLVPHHLIIMSIFPAERQKWQIGQKKQFEYVTLETKWLKVDYVV